MDIFVWYIAPCIITIVVLLIIYRSNKWEQFKRFMKKITYDNAWDAFLLILSVIAIVYFLILYLCFKL